MNIAIIDDNPDHQEVLLKYLKVYSSKHNISLNTKVFMDGLQIIDQYTAEFDIIYLDIQMEHLDGMTTAKKIRKIDQEVIIIFVTNHIQFAIEGYSVNATDFLLKPLTNFNFSEHFKKILKLLSEKKEYSIMIKTTGGIRKININDLYYIESNGHYIHFHSTDGDYAIWDTMKNMENKLKNYDFSRCNNSYLINLKYVQGIEDDLVIIKKEKLKISRPRKKNFLHELTSFLGKE